MHFRTLFSDRFFSATTVGVPRTRNFFKEDFKRHDPSGSVVVEQIDGVVEFDGNIYLVELKWLKDPIGVAELAAHMVRLFARDGVRGIFISNSEFASSAVAECEERLRVELWRPLCVKTAALVGQPVHLP